MEDPAYKMQNYWKRTRLERRANDMKDAYCDAEKRVLSINVPKDMAMTLDDAIAHLDETLGDPKHEWGCDDCRTEHEQLCAWLVELREMRDAAKRQIADNF